MIALAASALLGLYVLVPVYLFERAAQSFIRLKRHQRTRIEEFGAGILVSGIPFVATCLLFWNRQNAWADYKIVVNGLYSEHYFDANTDAFWNSLKAVSHHQEWFLLWNYLFLITEIAIVVLCVRQFGRLNQYAIFKNTVGKFLLKRVSEWEPLLTPFVFPPSEKRRVEVDVMVIDGKLYRGTVQEHFLGKDGELSGLLLKDASRFQYSKLEADREAKKHKDLPEYWKKIPGSNLYVSFEKIVTLNLRYELPDDDLFERVREKLRQLGIRAKLTIERPRRTRSEE